MTRLLAKWLIAVVVLLSPLRAQADEAVFDVRALTSTPLHARTLKSTEHKGIITEEVRFQSETDGDKDVEIFAYFSYPVGARQAPAFIWNPGGLGQASAGFTEPPARRGYAVLCIDFPQPGYRSTGNYPINRGLDLGTDPKHAPIYHGVVALLKAVSFLESRPEVDKNRIGMAGSSWGGFFTTLMVGIDPRLKVGSCLYGCGSLQLGNAWWDGVSRSSKQPPTPQERERWRTTLDPAWRLPTKETPIAWFTGTNDAFYSMPALMQSYHMAGGEKHLCLLPNWDHALPSSIQNEQVYEWLDVHLQSRPAFLKVSPVLVRNEHGRLTARWSFAGKPPATNAELIASYGDAGNWRHRYWHTLPATFAKGACRAELPSAKVPCYVSGTVVDEKGVRSSTPLVRVDPIALGVTSSVTVPDYDGCRMWGGFEEEQIAFLLRHNQSGQARWIPRLSSETKEGRHAAILEPGRTVLPPILSTAGMRNRLSFFAKSNKAATITVEIADAAKQFDIGTDWTEIAMETTPANTLMGGLTASLIAPNGGTILVDAFRFQPISERP